MDSKVKLRIVEGPMAGKEYQFDQHDTFLFGRAPECHASLADDSFISRYHFLLEINPPIVRLRDLGSLNGTFVNGACVGGHEPDARSQSNLHPGDRIQAGKTVFKIEGDTVRPHHPLVFCADCGLAVVDSLLQAGAGEIRCPACEAKRRATPNIHEQPTVLGRAPEVLLEGYTILKKLGDGRLGAVYQALREKTESRIAVKFLHTYLADDGIRNQFLHDMDKLRALRHVNIVNYVDIGTLPGGFYIAMEYCNKGNAESLMEQHGGKLPLELAVAILRQVLRGLDYAHAHKFVHRDIKPRNILLHGRTAVWKAKIADFGLAKNLDKAGISGLTATGNCAGTTEYMPREQVTNFKYITPASDVWSMAATFYTLATGEPSRAAQPGQDPIDAVLQGEIIPIEERLPEISPELAAVIGHALAARPEDRFPSAAEFRAAFKEAL